MEEDECEKDLRGLLANVCRSADFIILKSNVVDIMEDFECELRTTLEKEEGDTYDEQCDSWRKKFATEVNCDFIVARKHEGKQYVFLKKYVCHLSSTNKTKSENPRFTRNMNCAATLEMKVLINNDQQRWRDKKNGKLLTKGLDCQIKITFKHEHRVYVAEHVKMLKVSEETRNVFRGYFKSGMTPSAARAYHQMHMELEEVNEETLADSSCNPVYGQVAWLYKTWRSREFGDRTHESIVELLTARQEEYAERGITVHVKKDPFVAVVLTPIMKRAHQMKFAGEIVFVDTSGSCDQGASAVTFMFAASKVGGVPLAVIIHKDLTKESYTAAFEAVKEAVGPTGFGGKGEPSTFMTDDCSEEREPLKTVFPTALILLCIFHVCQAVWRWLMDTKNGVEQTKRQEVMLMFRKVLYATTETLCNEAMEAVKKSDTYKSNKLAKIYFDALFTRRPEWCIFERRGAVTKGNNTNNICEASVRIFKDYILDRCKAFNGVALVEFSGITLDDYHRIRLLSFANMHNTKPESQYKKFLAKSKDLEVRQTSQSVYKVSSSRTQGVEYEVDIDMEICDCPRGIGGSFCKHLCAVHVKAEVHLRNLPRLSCQDKVELVYLASGFVSNPNFYRSIRQTEDNDQPFADVRNRHDGPSAPERQCESEDAESAQQVMPSTSNSKDEAMKEAFGLLNAVSNIKDMVGSVENPEKHLIQTLRHMRKTFENIRTIPQLQNMRRMKFKAGRMIPVQPTSRSRRVKRAGFASGAKRIQGGRPSKFEVKLRKVKRKKPHNLSINISKNVANAKSHSTGM